MGCDYLRVCEDHTRQDFNPRTPVGCDHAQGVPPNRLANFNPRTPVGCDASTSRSDSDSWYFNPRTPVGCDVAPKARAAYRAYFNPRTPVGCDCNKGDIINAANRFQSTHPSGVRPEAEALRDELGISIHAPQWGATARMGIAFHNMEAPSVLKTDFIAKIHVHRSIHKFSNQKHQQTIHF